MPYLFMRCLIGPLQNKWSSERLFSVFKISSLRYGCKIDMKFDLSFSSICLNLKKFQIPIPASVKYSSIIFPFESPIASLYESVFSNPNKLLKTYFSFLNSMNPNNWTHIFL